MQACVPKPSTYNTLLQCLGPERALHLIKKVYGDDLVIGKDGKAGLLRGNDGKRLLTGTMALLTCVFYLELLDTTFLAVQFADLAVLSDIEKVCR